MAQLRKTAPPAVQDHGLALLGEAGAEVGCGRAVKTGGWVGLYDIATDPAHRRRGHGERMVRSLLDWGRQRGMSGAFLQVEAENRTAVRLYTRLGFRPFYRYGYRVKG